MRDDFLLVIPLARVLGVWGSITPENKYRRAVFEPYPDTSLANWIN